MSDDALRPDGSDAPDMAAGELALGLLEGDERAAALRRVLADHAFAAEVEAWRVHIAPWFEDWPETAPPETLLTRIEADLDRPTARTEPVAITPPPRRSWLWPSLATVSSLVAAALLLMLVSRPAPIPPPPPQPQATAPATLPAAMLAAALAPTAKGDGLTAVYDPATGGLRLTGAALADAQHSPELWVIAGDGVPHALGLVRSDGTRLTVAADDRTRLAAGATLAVSIEPSGGSPTGLPTGPIVAKGALAAV